MHRYKLLFLGLVILPALAQEPSIQIVEQDCTSGREYVLIQARVYNNPGKRANCRWRYSTSTDEPAILNLRPDQEDETLYWGFLPETPIEAGISGGVLEYTVEVTDPGGEVFSETSAIEITSSCLFSPRLNTAQADAKAKKEQVLTSAEKVAAERKRRRRNRNRLLIGGAAAVGAGVALAGGGSSSESPTVGNITLTFESGMQNNVTFDFAAPVVRGNISIAPDRASVSDTFSVDFCVSGDGASITSTRIDVTLSAASTTFSGFDMTNATITSRLSGEAVLSDDDFSIASRTSDTITFSLSTEFLTALIFEPENFGCPQTVTMSISGLVLR